MCTVGCAEAVFAGCDAAHDEVFVSFPQAFFSPSLPSLLPNSSLQAIVTVISQLDDDVTAIHWHGIEQRTSPWSDGVPGTTQCPIISQNNGGSSFEYRFSSSIGGTYWYHGHLHEQYLDGLYGALIVDDPVQDAKTQELIGLAGGGAAYVEDSQVWQVADWYDAPAMSYLSWYLSPESGGNEPMPDAFVVNNKLSWDASMPVAAFNVTLPRNGGPQRVRIINVAGFSMFRISVDGMPLTVVELDNCAVVPMDVGSIPLNVAMRASVILDFSRLSPEIASSPALWVRVQAMPAMYPTFDPDLPYLGLYGNTTGLPFETTWFGLITFAGEGGGLPTYDKDMGGESYTSSEDSDTYVNVECHHGGPCLPLASMVETNMLAARPLSPERAPPANVSMQYNIVFSEDENGINLAHVNGFTFAPHPTTADLQHPAILPLMAANAVVPPVAYSGSGAQPFVLRYGDVVDLLINNTDGGEHPIHLHGHQFWVVATSNVPLAKTLYASNYLRRDVVSVPAEGWALIRFVATNPGIWAIHCHIDWHVRAGLVAEIVEAPELLHGTVQQLPQSHTNACSLANSAAGAAALAGHELVSGHP